MLWTRDKPLLRCGAVRQVYWSGRVEHSQAPVRLLRVSLRIGRRRGCGAGGPISAAGPGSCAYSPAPVREAPVREAPSLCAAWQEFWTSALRALEAPAIVIGRRAP